MEPGAHITFAKNPNYWANGNASVKGFYNIGEIRYDYYRDATAITEAFRAGDIAFRTETEPNKWQDALNFPAGEEGLILKSEFEMKLPKPYNAIVFNTRRAPFDNRQIRKALFMLFDSNEVNELFYASQFNRTQSIFFGSVLSPVNISANDAELALLNNDLDENFINGQFTLYEEGTRFRSRMRDALKIFKAEGWEIKDGILTELATNKPMEFEFLVRSAQTERIALAYQNMLKKVGVTLNISQVDSAQYTKRKQSFDYDLVTNTWYFSLSPGAEQGLYWTTTAADTEGSRNYMGLKDSQIDEIILYIEQAKSYEDLTTGVRALSRSIGNSYTTIPLFHAPKQWVTHWNYMKMHSQPSWYGSIAETWWVEE